MRKLYVTIDTEMDSDIHWVKSYPPTYTSVIEGIPKILRPIWNKLEVHPIYFVSPEVLFNQQCCKILRDEIRKGAIIGAHLHPEYIEPLSSWGAGMSETKPQFPCSAYSKRIEFEKIKNLTLLIEEKLGITPVWYRAARFGADIDTIHSLIELGYQFDSSITPNINWSSIGGPDHSKASISPYIVAENDYYAEPKNYNKVSTDALLREIPITILGKRFGILGKLLPDHWLSYQWLRPTHMTLLELKYIIRKLRINHYNEIVMMFHSMEIMINKSPYVRNKLMQRYYLFRLEKSLSYAKKKGYQL